jgi:RNA polymerase sigma-70 factor (ECF subfamily)
MASPVEFVQLYEREAEPVLVYFARRTLDAELALDLTAETFAQAWGGWAGVRTDQHEEVRGWLFTIARRQLGRYLRRGRVERRARARWGLERLELSGPELEEIERLAGLEPLRAALAGELARLSAGQRQALELRIVRELPYPQVAQQLGIAEPAARARVSRALRVLALALEPIAAADKTEGL